MLRASLVAQDGKKKKPATQVTQVQSLSQEDPLEKETATLLPGEFLPGEFHGLRSLVGHSLWGRKESDTTE